jgi:hypothetical protein
MAVFPPWFVEDDGNGKPVIICLNGYAGERGDQLVPPWDVPSEERSGNRQTP